MLSSVEIIGLGGFILQILGQMAYLRALFITKSATPHAFTWLVWGFIMAIGAIAQFSQGERLAIIFLSEGSVFCLFIGIIALMRQKIAFTRFDYWCLGIALCIIPLWLITNTPLYSVILISIIDGMMILPTIRKSWNDPYSEPLGVFVTGTLVSFSSLLVLNDISMITAFYPTTIIVVNISFIITILLRRSSLSYQ